VSLTEPNGKGILDSERVLYTPANGGTVTWVSGDVYRVLASAEDGTGAIGIIDGLVPVGAGPLAHVHERTDESFFLLSGTIAFLGGEKTITAEPGAFVHVPRGTLHRFMNVGDDEARMLFFFNPGGPELMFLHAGDKPEPGSAPIVWDADRTAEAMAKVAPLNLDLHYKTELDHLFQPEGGRPAHRG
jgi:mannose-6-phosphate isomerase-like protein (cupin superfamily)